MIYPWINMENMRLITKIKTKMEMDLLQEKKPELYLRNLSYLNRH